MPYRHRVIFSYVLFYLVGRGRTAFPARLTFTSAAHEHGSILIVFVIGVLDVVDLTLHCFLLLFDLVETFHRQFGHRAKCERTTVDLELRLHSNDRIDEILDVTEACGALNDNRPRIPSVRAPMRAHSGLGLSASLRKAPAIDRLILKFSGLHQSNS